MPCRNESRQGLEQRFSMFTASRVAELRRSWMVVRGKRVWGHKRSERACEAPCAVEVPPGGFLEIVGSAICANSGRR